MSSKPAPAKDPSGPSPVSDIDTSAIHDVNPLSKFFKLAKNFGSTILLLRHWRRLTGPQRRSTLLAALSAAVALIFVGHEMVGKLRELWPRTDADKIIRTPYEVGAADFKLEGASHYWRTEAGKVETGSKDDGEPLILADGSHVAFVRDPQHPLGDFDGVFELLIRHNPQKSTWVVRRDQKDIRGYRFRLTLPPESSRDPAVFDAALVRMGEPDKAVRCSTFGDFFIGSILPGHVMRIAIRAIGDKVVHRFLLMNPSDVPSHPQAKEGESVTVSCAFPENLPPGQMSFHATLGSLAIRNFKLCPPPGAKGFSEDCVEMQ